MATTTLHAKEYINTFPSPTSSNTRKEHYQLSGMAAVRCCETAVKMKKSIEKHCEGNLFIVNCQLKNLASSAIIPDTAKNDILQFASKGQKRFEEFVMERLLLTSPSSV